jgi:hypothetical protein
MEPTILRFDPTPPDSAELRYYLRHAGTLLAASDIEGPARVAVLRRARTWMAGAIAGIDQLIQQLAPAVPETIHDHDTEAHEVCPVAVPSLKGGVHGTR